MKKFFYNRTLLIFIGVGLFAALIIAGQRFFVESENKQIDLAIDYQNVVKLQALALGKVDDALIVNRQVNLHVLRLDEIPLTRDNQRGKKSHANYYNKRPVVRKFFHCTFSIHYALRITNYALPLPTLRLDAFQLL